jgi:hypothetical protein
MDLLYRLLCAGARVRFEPDAVIYHERQDKARRLATRWSYGYGMGAFCGIWLRRGDLFALRMLGSWLRWQGSALVGALVRAQWMQVHQSALSLGGTGCGSMYGLRARHLG